MSHDPLCLACTDFPSHVRCPRCGKLGGPKIGLRPLEEVELIIEDGLRRANELADAYFEQLGREIE